MGALRTEITRQFEEEIRVRGALHAIVDVRILCQRAASPRRTRIYGMEQTYGTEETAV